MGKRGRDSSRRRWCQLYVRIFLFARGHCNIPSTLAWSGATGRVLHRAPARRAWLFFGYWMRERALHTGRPRFYTPSHPRDGVPLYSRALTEIFSHDTPPTSPSLLRAHPRSSRIAAAIHGLTNPDLLSRSTGDIMSASTALPSATSFSSRSCCAPW